MNMKTTQRMCIGLAGVIATAGGASGRFCMGGPDGALPGAIGSASARRLVLVSGDKIRGMNVYNSQHEEAGEIKDLVIERGSGRVTHLVVATGSNMNLDGKVLAIPYEAFVWDEGKKHLMVTGESADSSQWPEFSKDRWMKSDRDQQSLNNSLSSGYYRRSPDGRLQSQGAPTRVQGRVKQIERRAGVDGSPEMVVVTVVGDGAAEQQVIAGPSWYLAGQNVALFRDATVEMSVTHAERDGQACLVASEIMTGPEKVAIYDKEGWPTWYSSSGTGDMGRPMPGPESDGMSKGSGTKGAWSAGPLVLGSELDGKNINCRNETCGEVDDLIVECMSGRVAFVSIDPDENFLGIGDTKRLIPWALVTPGADNKVWLDASRAMIVTAPEVPSDWEAYATEGLYKRVYTSFDSPVVEFNGQRR